LSEIFGKNLKAIREKEGLSQKALADTSEINYRHYQEIEASRIDIKHNTAKNLARVLNIPSCYLYQANLNPILVKEDILCPIEILNHLPLGTLVFDKNGRIIYSNKFFRENFFHRSKTELEKGEFYVWDLIHGSDEDKSVARKHFSSIISESPEPSPASWKYTGPNQQPIEVFVEWDYLKNHRGQVVHYIACVFATSRINMMLVQSETAIESKQKFE
jgi:transcriptional regulator with XRE-family HTH domain